MINISDFKRLGIILPNTNKALGKVLSEATHKELESISQGKDLKSIMNSILKQSASVPSSNKQLLELVKNNPTLKNLGDVTKTVQDLLNAIKSEKSPNPLEKVLQNFLSSVKNTSTQQNDIKNQLTSLIKDLQASDSKTSTNITKEAQLTLTTGKDLNKLIDSVKTTLSSLSSDKQSHPLEKVLQNFLSNIKDIKNSDLKQKLENSGVFLESKIKNAPNPLQELKNTLITLAKNFQTSNTPANRAIANEAKTILNTEVLKNTPSSKAVSLESIVNTKENPKDLQKLSTQVQNLVEKIKTLSAKPDTIHSPQITKALEQLDHKLDPKLLNVESFKLASIKEPLEQISAQISKSFNPDSKTILGALEKIFAALKSIEQTATTPKANLEMFSSQKMPQKIQDLGEVIKNAIQKTDPIFHKESTMILNKLETLQTPQQLSSQNSVKEILSNDLKAILLQAGDEIVKSKHPNQAEIMKHIDKLSLQIDNYQLLSHLSNGSSMYLPYSWDMMEDGNITMKKSEDEKFYVDIDLKLKEYGQLNLKLALYDKNQLNLNIYTANQELKSLIQTNIPSLRSALIETQITPREIRVHEPKGVVSASPYSSSDDGIYMGFEVKG